MCQGLSTACKRSETRKLASRPGVYRVGSTYLAFTVGPKIHGDADKIVYGGIGALVEQDGHEYAQRVECESCADAAVEARVGDQPWEWVFPCQAEDAKEDVEDLQDRDGLDGGVQDAGRVLVCVCV